MVMESRRIENILNNNMIEFCADIPRENGNYEVFLDISLESENYYMFSINYDGTNDDFIRVFSNYAKNFDTENYEKNNFEKISNIEDFLSDSIIIKNILKKASNELFSELDFKWIKKLWLEFGDIPMNPETEEIEEDWNDFPAGTHREDIWHWFEETFNVSVAENLMGMECEGIL